MKKELLLASMAGVLSLATTVSMAAAIKIGGGGAACGSFIAPVEESFEAETGISLDVRSSSPSQGLIELKDGQLDMATGAVSFEEMIRGAAKSGINIDPLQFTVRQIGSNRTLLFTHRSNKVKSLSKKQLQNIFTGKVTNWKQVGGANQEVVVVWGIATPGQNELFTKKILDGKSITRKHQEVADYRSIRNFVAKNPGAIGIAPQDLVSSATRNPQIPFLDSPVIAVTKGAPSVEIETLLSYVKELN